MRARAAGLVLLALAAGAWLALVPPQRERALALARERAELEARHRALAAEVAELEHRLEAAPAAGATLGPVALRAVVVEALEPLLSAQAIRLDVSADGAEISLSLSGELDELLGFIDRLTHPEGPATLARVSLRPRRDVEVEIQLEALQPGAGG